MLILGSLLWQYCYIGSLDITIPRYNDLIPGLPWRIVIPGFHYSELTIILVTEGRLPGLHTHACGQQ